MTRDEVLTGLGVLRAGFPHSTVPSETVELYVSRLMVYDFATFSDVVKEVLDADDHFPTLHRIVEGCRSKRKREEEAHALAALPPGLPDAERILPDVARAFREKAAQRTEPEFVRALDRVPVAPTGVCDDCKEHVATRLAYGKFELCKRCCSRRLLYALSQRELVA